jgi:hypothetical protein
LNAGEPRVSFPDSDEVGSGIGLAQVSHEPISYARVSENLGIFFVSFPIRFLLTLNRAVGTLDLKGSRLKTVLDPKTLTLALDTDVRNGS